MVALFGIEIPVLELFLVFMIISIIVLAEAIVILLLLLKGKHEAEQPEQPMMPQQAPSQRASVQPVQERAHSQQR